MIISEYMEDMINHKHVNSNNNNTALPEQKFERVVGKEKVSQITTPINGMNAKELSLMAVGGDHGGRRPGNIEYFTFIKKIRFFLSLL